MKVGKSLGLVIALSLQGHVWAEVDTDPPPPPERSTLQSPQVTLPLDATAPRPTIEAMINGKGPSLFVLDTGAQGFVLHSDLARELGLPIVGTAAMGDPSNADAIEADRVEIQSIDIDGVSLEGVVADSWDVTVA